MCEQVNGHRVNWVDGISLHVWRLPANGFCPKVQVIKVAYFYHFSLPDEVSALILQAEVLSTHLAQLDCKLVG